MKNITVFYLKFFSFLDVKFSIYLNRRVFVMDSNADNQINVSRPCFSNHSYIIIGILWSYFCTRVYLVGTYQNCHCEAVPLTLVLLNPEMPCLYKEA